ncbi:hypothetical protein Arub01_44110 [Actinomadura rubrobrunea]|uniref:Chitinase n=1 Tax=Actinomadura rubrobrunea TaxID=115335 RepID=A0A9W6UYE8_9ACTN|nr:hypothetical protein [Actinomadura rubrobrunea]GLW66167.1 hypothetical protein Arub01_44110 [Actinomadura rubrobrunea]
MSLSGRTKILIAAAGLAGAGALAAGGAALADTGPQPARTELRIVDYQYDDQAHKDEACPWRDGQAPSEAADTR